MKIRWRVLLVIALLNVAVLYAEPPPAGTGASPLSSSSEAAETGTMLLISTVAAVVFRPIIGVVVGKIGSLPNEAAGGIMAGLMLALYLLGWWLIGGKTADTPSDWQHWVQGAFSAVGISTLGVSGVKTQQAVNNTKGGNP